MIPGKRLDIQGLRAVAVLAVVADHLTDWPSGGFVGVDVFFVISGFLITGRLLRMAGEVSVGRYFATFYELRARRILPAALVTIVLTIAASAWVYDGQRVRDIAIDGVWAAIFGANWHFAANGTDYLHADGPVSPFQHYWSLAVEEQFYLVWPVLLLGLVLLVLAVPALRGAPRAGRTTGSGAGVDRTKRIVAAGVATAVIVASFAFALHQTDTTPAVAYFSSFTRAWELALGALLAAALPALRQLPGSMAPALSWGGLALIAGSLFAISDSTAFPAPAAAMPVVGSALVIAGGAVGRPWNPLLTNPASVYVGDLSYSIYLVHFPLVVLLGSLMPEATHWRWAAVVLGTLGLSMASYYFVEEPARSWRSGHRADRSRLRLKGATALVLTAAAAALYLQQPSVASAPMHGSRFAVDGGDPTVVRPSPELAEALRQAVRPGPLPEVRNPDQAIAETALEDWAPCATETALLDSCRFTPPGGTDPHRVALVIGDSVALSLLPAIREALVPEGWTVVGFAKTQCPAAVVPVTRRGQATRDAGCDAHHDAYASIADQVDPSLVVLISATETLDRMYGDQSPFGYAAGLTEAIKAVSGGPDRRVDVLSPSPLGKNLAVCGNRHAEVGSCLTSLDRSHADQVELDRRTATETGAGYLNLEQLFCVGGICPAIVDDLAVRYDATHVTPAYGAVIAPSLRAALLGYPR